MISVEDSVLVKISRLRIYVDSSEEALLCTVRCDGVLKESNDVQTMKEVQTERKRRTYKTSSWSVFQSDQGNQNPKDLEMVK